jgi:lysophosphatidylcholine acyltransferase/lyso-PAF acetyltransferase
MKVPCTWHGYDDVRLQMEAQKLSLPVDAGVVGMQGVQEVFGHDIRQSTVSKHMEKFAKMDTNHTGRINFSQFARGFDVEETDDLRHLFELLDNDGSGYIDFREYLLGLALLNESKDRTGILKLVFKVFDQDER